MEKAVIRPGKKEDCASVLSLIQDLADYEKASDQVILTLETLEKDGFGNRKLFDMFVAEINLEIVGVAIFYPRYSTWKGETLYLEDLIVKEEYRGKKIGSQLFEQVIFETKKRNAARMEWQILDWNEPALNFYKKYNSQLDSEWINGKLDFKQIQNFAVKT